MSPIWYLIKLHRAFLLSCSGMYCRSMYKLFLQFDNRDKWKSWTESFSCFLFYGNHHGVLHLTDDSTRVKKKEKCQSILKEGCYAAISAQLPPTQPSSTKCEKVKVSQQWKFTFNPCMRESRDHHIHSSKRNTYRWRKYI